MAIDLRHMLKVYNYINDEKRPKVNLKFLGLFAALVVVTGAMIFFSVEVRPSISEPQTPESRTEFVGLTPTEVAVGAPSSLADTRLEAWRDQHPDAQIEHIEPVYDDGRLIGYNLTFRE